MHRTALVVAALTLSATAHAQNLIYFEENGGAAGPRGLYTLDLSTGSASLRAPVGGAERFFGMCVQPGTNTVFAVSVPGNTGLWKMDPDTGTTTLIGMTGVETMADIHFHPTTGKLYGVQRNEPYGIYEINPATAGVTFIANTNDAARCGMVIDALGQAYGFTTTGILSKLDLLTGATTLVGGAPVPGGPLEDADLTPDGTIFFTMFFGTVWKCDPGSGLSGLVHTTGMGSGLLGIIPEVETCYADCNGDGVLTAPDFGCFQTKFVAGDPYADCDQSGNLTVADFGCFQTKFVAGCP